MAARDSALRRLTRRVCPRFYVLRQAEFGCKRDASKVAWPFQMAKATRNNLRARMTRACVGAQRDS